MSPKPYISAFRLERDKVTSFAHYPFSIPAIRHLRRLELDPKITFFVGENGIGKSTLIESLAMKWGFNAEGGSINFRFSTKDSHSDLKNCLVLEKGLKRPRDGYFLRAESFYTLATEIERLEAIDNKTLGSYGGSSLHEQSHGEAFLSLLKYRLGGEGLYIFDEPEAALSPGRQMSVLVLLHDLIASGSQFIIATHSPILLSYPGALIYQLEAEGIKKVSYKETDHYRLTVNFLNNPEKMLKHLLQNDEAE